MTLAIRSGTGTDGAALTCAANPVATNGAGDASWTDCSIDLAGSKFYLDAAAGGATGHDDAAFDIYSGLPVTTAFTAAPSLGTAGWHRHTARHPGHRRGRRERRGCQRHPVHQGRHRGGWGDPLCDSTTVATDPKGDANFTGCTIDKAATGYQLHAAVTGATASDSGTFDIGAGAASNVAFTTQPAGAPAGATLTAQPVVHVADDQGNAVSGASVGLTITPATGAVGANLACTSSMVTTDASGDAVFAGCSIDLAGNGYRLDATTNGVTVSSTVFTVSSGLPATLTFAAQPSGGVAGAAFGTQPVVHAVDEAGHPAVGASVTLAITPATGDPDASLDCSPLSVTTNGTGNAIFSGCSISLAATDYRLRASAGPAIPADSNVFDVTPDVASSLEITGFPSTTTAGVPGSLTVTARDQYGNTATGYAGTVHFTSTDGSATVPDDYTFATGDHGVRTFTNGLTLVTAGARSITVTDTMTGSIAGVLSDISVGPAAAASLDVAGFPTPVVAGESKSFTVTARDPFGNTATGYAGSIRITSSDDDVLAVLPGNYAFQPGDQGVRLLTATLVTAGTQTITATDTGNAAITGTQTGIIVQPASSAVTLVVSGFPDPTTAGVTHAFTVTARDSYGNTVTGTPERAFHELGHQLVRACPRQLHVRYGRQRDALVRGDLLDRRQPVHHGRRRRAHEPADDRYRGSSRRSNTRARCAGGRNCRLGIRSHRHGERCLRQRRLLVPGHGALRDFGHQPGGRPAARLHVPTG